MSIDFEDLAGTPEVDDKALKGLTQLCEKTVAAQREVVQAEADLKQAKERLRILVERDIPDMADDLGVSELKLRDGSSVLVRDILNARISENMKPKAHRWLRENGHGDLIKNEVVAKFGAGDDEVANAVANYLEESHVSYLKKESVHYQTLNAFVREQVSEGHPIPEDVLGVYRGRQAVINLAK